MPGFMRSSGGKDVDDRDKPGHDGAHAAMQVFGWSGSAKLGGALVVRLFWSAYRERSEILVV
jgi:hypothetical protein